MTRARERCQSPRRVVLQPSKCRAANPQRKRPAVALHPPQDVGVNKVPLTQLAFKGRILTTEARVVSMRPFGAFCVSQ